MYLMCDGWIEKKGKERDTRVCVRPRLSSGNAKIHV